MKRSLLLICLATALLPAGVSALQISRSSGNAVYIDTTVGGSPPFLPTCNYVSFQVYNNDASAYNDLWVTLGSFTNANLGLAPSENGLSHLGGLAVGLTKTAFFYVCGTQTASSISGTVGVHPAPPPAGALATQVFAWFDGTYSVRETIQASPNKVTAILTGPKPPTIGGIVTLTVSGDTGQTSAGDPFYFSPATAYSWPSGTFELYQTSIYLNSPTAVTYTNQLAFAYDADNSTAYIATYLFRAQAATVTNTTASPVNYIWSGSDMKHTSLSGYGSGAFEPISPPSNTTLLTASAGAASVVYPAYVRVTVTVTNSGANDMALDGFRLSYLGSPGAPAVVAGSSLYNGAATADPITITGSVIAWNGTYSVPAGATRTLSFDLSFPATSGTYTFSQWALVGISTQIDTTLSTADSAPASFNINVSLPTPTSTISPSHTASPVVTPTPTFSFSPVITSTSTVSPAPTQTSTITPSITRTHSETSTVTPSITRTYSETSTITPSITPTHSETSTITPSITPTHSSTSSITPSVTQSFTASPPATDTASPTISPTSTGSPTQSWTPSETSTITPSITQTYSPTSSVTPSLTQSFTASPLATDTASPTISPTSTATPASSATPTSSWTLSESSTATPSATPTLSTTSTITSSATPSHTASPLASDTASPTISPTSTMTPSATPSPADTATSTPQPTATATASPTPTETPVVPVLSGLGSASGLTTGGYSLVINGGVFLPGAVVTIDGVTCTVTVFSSGSLTVMVPAHAPATVNVVVTNPGGYASNALSFTYVAPTATPTPTHTPTASASPTVTLSQTPATPVLTSLGSASGLTTGGYSLVLSGSSFQPGAAVTFGGLTATVVSLSAGSITVIVPAQAAGPVNVVVTNPGGFSSTALVFTYLDPTPTPSFLTGTLGPVPSKAGQPLCFYASSSLAHSHWTVFGLDQQVVARLDFDTAGRHCFTATHRLAPGNYFVKIRATDIHGQTSTFTRRIIIER